MSGQALVLLEKPSNFSPVSVRLTHYLGSDNTYYPFDEHRKYIIRYAIYHGLEKYVIRNLISQPFDLISFGIVSFTSRMYVRARWATFNFRHQYKITLEDIVYTDPSLRNSNLALRVNLNYYETLTSTTPILALNTDTFYVGNQNFDASPSTGWRELYGNTQMLGKYVEYDFKIIYDSRVRKTFQSSRILLATPFPIFPLQNQLFP